MSKQNTSSIQICILKVNIACKCQGCEKKVKNVLSKIKGVDAVKMNLEEGEVEVVGNVDPNELLKNLKKKGKHAEICTTSNAIAKKNENEEGKKTKGSFLGSLFGFGKKSKNVAGTCKNCKNNNGNDQVLGPDTKFSKKNNGNDHDIPTISHDGGEGSNGNMGQMVIVNNNGSMQEDSMMNNENHHHHQGMQLMQVQPSLYDQQPYMVMMNQQQEQGNMNMYPSTMMYGGPHYMANPTHSENVRGYWIM